MTQDAQLTLLYGSAIDSAFIDFHRANPHVYDALVRLTRQAAAAGRSKVGIGMLFEVLRWEQFLVTSDPDFKLNNNWRSRYARLIMEQEPELAGIFEVRSLRS